MSVWLSIGWLVSLIAFGLWCLPCLVLLWWRRHRLDLTECQAAKGPGLPKVSVVIAVRNEEAALPEALSSLLQQSYQNMEVVAVNDRSTDSSGAILTKMAAEHANLQVVQIDELPERWLGKCYALNEGNKRTSGDYLLFTDADVIFAPDALAKAMAIILDQEADHLAVVPEILTAGPMEKALVASFLLNFVVAQRVWKINQKSSRAMIGVGAFNLVSRDIYRKIGGHHTLRLEVLDDVGLGYLARKRGGRQRVAFGYGEVFVGWFGGTFGLSGALEKNGFAFVGYKVWPIVLWLPLCLIANWIPLVGLFWPFVPALTVLNGITLVGMLTAYRLVASPYPWWCPLLNPFVGLLQGYAVVRSMVLNLLQRGVRWRDTFYPLSVLKRGMVYRRPYFGEGPP